MPNKLWHIKKNCDKQYYVTKKNQIVENKIFEPDANK